LLQGTATAGMGILDNFDRADGPLGSNWTVQNGTVSIVNNEAVGSDFALATYNGVTSNALEADVRANGTNLQYVGLVLGYADLNNNLFMKVQEQNASGKFEFAAFYYGNNGGSWDSPGFFTLDSPFTSAHMRVELTGGVVTMTFSGIDGGSGIETYTSASVPGTIGTGIGILGFDGYATLDNFAAEIGTVPVPVPGAALLGFLGMGTAFGWLRRHRTL
jgi:hypothetical protein